MKIQEQGVNARNLKEKIIEAIQNKRGRRIVTLDISKIENSISDYFIICHGTSTTHVDAIADSVIENIGKELGEKPVHKEGRENLTWVLLDYENVVVHIFQEEYRKFYNLEDLWADAHVETYQEENH
ncbi:MAG: ribosome silencing factor [Bacteroidales bacterium]